MPGLSLATSARPWNAPANDDMGAATVDVGDLQLDQSKTNLEIETPDGGVIIRIGSFKPPSESKDFDDNMAEYVSEEELGRIADELLRGIAQDDESRSEWLRNRAEGIKLLGLKIESLRSQAGDGASPVEGMSQARHPALIKALIRFQANALAELYPADGPAKVRNDDPNETPDQDDLADVLEKDLNHYLTATDKDYIPDSDAQLLHIGLDGCGFKKVYHDPIKRRPVSLSVSAEDLIVSQATTSIHSCGRVTHRVFMRPSILKRMQLLGAYRDVYLGDPGYQEKSPIDQETEEVSGIKRNDAFEARDRDYELYECYCELDIVGFEHETRGKRDGLALPYKVVIEKESKQVLEIRRNWAEDDPMWMPKVFFVQFPFIRGFGFYGIGLSHLLGNTTNGLTAIWREIIDTGMFANFPGFLYAKGAGRQNTNEFRIPPGGGQGIETGGQSIKDVVMALPYKEAGPGFVGFAGEMGKEAADLGGTAEIQVGEGRENAPVGTTLALIEQAIKPMMAVHKRLHQAQAIEFQLLVERFREDPEAFWRFNKKPAHPWDEAQLLKALDTYSIVPQADPNTASHLHRVSKGAALYQIGKDDPIGTNKRAIQRIVIRGIGYSNPDQFLSAQQAPPPDPKAQAEQTSAQADLIDAQAKAAKVQLDAQNTRADLANDAADRESKEKIAGLQLQREGMIEAGRQAQENARQRSEQAHEAGLTMAGHAHDAGIAAAGAASDHAMQAADHAHEQTMAAMAPPPSQIARARGGRVDAKTKIEKAKKILSPDFTPPRKAPDGMIYTLHKPTGVYHRVDGLG